MVRERDRFWEYADDLKGRFSCKFCGREFSGGSTRIKAHLSGLNRRDIVICSEVPEDVKLDARQAITATEKKLGKSRSSNNDEEITEGMLTSAPNKKAKRLHQRTILGESKKDKSVVDKMLAKFLFSSNITPHFATMPCLVDLLRSVAEFGPSYEIPNTSALTSQLIPGIKVEEHIGNVKKFFTTTGCTLLMYNVEEDSKVVCINVFAYTPAGVFYTNKIAVPEQGMTSSNFMLSLWDSICSIIESLGPENVFQCIVHKRVINMNMLSSGTSMIREKYPWIHLHENAFHLVSYLVGMYLSVPWIHKTTKLAAVIFRYLHKHDLLPQRDHSSNIESYIAVNRLGHMIAIEFCMLRTILEVEKELQAWQPLPIASEGPSREENVAEIVDEAIHSKEFWSRGKKVEQVLRSLFLCLELTYGKGSTFGYLYEASKGIEEAIKPHCDGDDQIHGEIIMKWFIRWSSNFVKPVHAAAAFLNPAYFCSETFTEDTHEMQEGLHHLTLLAPPEEQEALSKQLQLYRMKVPELFSNPAMEMRNKIHPRKWWECFGDPCPILQKLAIRILSQPCSIAIRRFVNFQPNDPVDELRMNIIMMEEFGMIKSKSLEPTHLDRMSHKLHVYANEYVKNFVERNHQIYKARHGLLLIDNPNDQIADEYFRSKRSATLLEINNLIFPEINPVDGLCNSVDLADLCRPEIFGRLNDLPHDFFEFYLPE